MTDRPHGRQRYIQDKCRCDVCRTAATEYGTWLKKQNAYGRPRTVDAQPARDHVAMLRKHGIGIRRISLLSGVSEPVLSKLIYGIPSAGRPPTRRMYTATAAKLLAVTAEGNLAEGAQVSIVGVRRRVQALVAIGWSFAKLAARLGMLPGRLANMTAYNSKITVRIDREIRGLYEELWDTRPDESELYDRISAVRARNLAAREGWPPPMWWEAADDGIDDPCPTDQERAEIVRRMSAAGAGINAMCRAAMASRRTVRRLLEAS